MVQATLNAFHAALRESQLLQPAQLAELTTQLLPRFADPHALARQLRALGWLTPFQVDHLLQGQGQSLVLGQYTLLDRLGEGGMAQVFKARHRGLHRVVALKVLRTELHSCEEAVRRFQREIRAIARLDHPNIVHAYDAEELGSLLFFVMEYCEGIDLSELVWRLGPLPIDEACDYIRQAACGLAHIHEAGLVHRDIKASNLLLTTGGGQVKILDLGLVGLRLAVCDVAQSILTHEWTMVGTPDYVAPEQIMNAHMADSRADLYSLGCTFYFLLAGQLPFPSDNMREKLMMHRCLEPVPVEEIRPEVPLEVAEVVRRLMAKNPAERFETAAEVAEVAERLASLADVVSG